MNNKFELGPLEADKYQEDGVIKIKGVFTHEQMAVLRSEIDREIDLNNEKAFAYVKPENGRFLGSQDLWRTSEVCRSICAESAMPAIVGELTRSSYINLFFDHLFVKEPGADIGTNLHNDGAYWPIAGDKICSAWISVDTARSNSGAMVFVIGSHRWASSYQPASFALRKGSASINDSLKIFARKSGRNIDDLSFKVIETQPGDVLVFSSRILHAAFGNGESTNKRRGYVVRFTGDDVRYDPNRAGVHKMMIEPSLEEGDPLTCERFPLVWQRSANEQLQSPSET